MLLAGTGCRLPIRAHLIWPNVRHHTYTTLYACMFVFCFTLYIITIGVHHHPNAYHIMLFVCFCVCVREKHVPCARWCAGHRTPSRKRARAHRRSASKRELYDGACTFSYKLVCVPNTTTRVRQADKRCVGWLVGTYGMIGSCGAGGRRSTYNSSLSNACDCCEVARVVCCAVYREISLKITN